MTNNQQVPREARVVIVGGGVVGCSVAYHLAALGWRDIVLLEQGQIGGGTTWHAADLVGQLRASNSLTLINKYSVELYARLEAETGIPTGWRQVGSLIAGRSTERMTQLRRTVAMAGVFGVEASVLSPSEAGEKWPLMRTDDLQGAVWLPHDGKVRTVELTQSLARGATMRGAKIYEAIEVVELIRGGPDRYTVRTSQGDIACGHVVICGGMWSRQLLATCGIALPLYPVEHHYVVSAPIEGCSDDLPVGRDPDAMIYFRGEAGGIMLGAFQKSSTAWDIPSIPRDFSFQLLPPDWEKFAQPLAAGKWRLPVLENTPLPKFVNGPESFTPDNNFIMGELPGWPGLFAAAGFNSVGIASAGGAGRYLAEWMAGGAPSIDLWSVDPRRFMPCHNELPFLRERVTEVLGLHYQMAWPNREFETGRDLRLGPLHARLAAAGASFGQKAGIERPLYFAKDEATRQLTYTWERPAWHQTVAAEHRACRENVALFDQSSFGKFLVEGQDACAVLQQLCANNIDVTPGRAVYTGMLNPGGGFESDLVVVRTGPDTFYIVGGTAQAARDFDWIRAHIPADAHCKIREITTSRAVLALMGPSSRRLLQTLTDHSLENPDFPFAAARQILIAGIEVLAIRITYVGELGWELHVDAAHAVALYDALHEAGASFALQNAGYYTINGLRLEKGYRAWGAELSPADTPLEAGLAFCVAWDKAGGFIGRDALIALRGRTPRRRLFSLVCEDPRPLWWGNEPILCNGKVVGYTASAAYGHTLGASIALGYIRGESDGVNPEFMRSDTFSVLLDGVETPCRISLQAPYDTSRAKVLS